MPKSPHTSEPINPSTGSSVSDEDAGKQLQGYKDTFASPEEKMSAEERKAKETSDAEKKTREEEIKKNCAAARQNIATIQAKPNGKIVDNQGQVTRLTDEKREALLKENQEFIDKYCQ